jgi:hypothetical protein
MKIRYEYSTVYNFRPDELYGMGKESLRVQSPKEGVSLESFLEIISHNSNLKHTSITEYIYGLSQGFEREDWKPWLGQPMFYMTDIKCEIVED